MQILFTFHTSFRKAISIFILSITVSAGAAAQQPVDSLINVTGDNFFKDEANFPGAFVYLKTTSKQVYIEHRGIKMWCDQALLYKDQNFVRAIGNVKMNQGDSIRMNSKFAEYNGDTQLAFANGEVRMSNPDTRLETDSLFFDRLRQQAYYRSGGTVSDTASTLTSQKGRYFMKDKKYQFLDNVVVNNPEYTIESGHLVFYSESGHARLYGPSTITGKSSIVYCERGFYDTRNDTGYFVKNSRIDYNNRTIYGDSLFFDRNRSFASATNHIKVLDTLNNSIVKGHYAEVFREKDSVFITKRALAITVQENDSVYIHADTLMITGKPDNRIVRGFYRARLFKSDLSGKADSIVSLQKIGLTKLITEPVMWSEGNQITGDSIFLQSNSVTEQLDSLHVFNNAFVVNPDTMSGGYNQIKSKELFGFFTDNKLSLIRFNRNVENIMYSRDEDQNLIGINRGNSGIMEIELDGNEMVTITNLSNYSDKTYPPEEFKENVRIMRGFNWRGEEELKSKNDLFKGKPPLKLVPIKGIPLPTIEPGFFEPYRDLEDNKNSRLRPEDLRSREKDSLQLQKTLPILRKKS
ncbi:MAG: OstA-like protein [Nonlabens sp.]